MEKYKIALAVIVSLISLLVFYKTVGRKIRYMRMIKKVRKGDRDYKIVYEKAEKFAEKHELPKESLERALLERYENRPQHLFDDIEDDFKSAFLELVDLEEFLTNHGIVKDVKLSQKIRKLRDEFQHLLKKGGRRE